MIFTLDTHLSRVWSLLHIQFEGHRWEKAENQRAGNAAGVSRLKFGKCNILIQKDYPSHQYEMRMTISVGV